jgi:hypothetical protein
MWALIGQKAVGDSEKVGISNPFEIVGISAKTFQHCNRVNNKVD